MVSAMTTARAKSCCSGPRANARSSACCRNSRAWAAASTILADLARAAVRRQIIVTDPLPCHRRPKPWGPRCAWREWRRGAWHGGGGRRAAAGGLHGRRIATGLPAAGRGGAAPQRSVAEDASVAGIAAENGLSGPVHRTAQPPQVGPGTGQPARTTCATVARGPCWASCCWIWICSSR